MVSLCYININGMRLIPLMLSFLPCSSNYIILLHWFLSTLDGNLWCYHSFPMFLSCCFNSLPLLLCFNHSFHLYFMCSHMLKTNTNGVRFISLMSSFIPSCINLCLPILWYDFLNFSMNPLFLLFLRVHNCYIISTWKIMRKWNDWTFRAKIPDWIIRMITWSNNWSGITFISFILI